MNDNKYPVHLRVKAVLSNWDTIVSQVEGAEDMEAVDHLHAVCSPEEHARVRQWWAKVSPNPEQYSEKEYHRAWEDYFQSVASIHALSAYLP